MSESSTVLQPEAAPKSLFARLLGVIVSPAATFANVARYPRWFGALVLVIGITAVANFAFLSTDVGQSAMLDQQIRQQEAWGRTVTDADQTRMEGMLPAMRYIVAGSILVAAPVFTLVLAGILFGVFTGMMGGNATFKQVFSILANAGAVSLLQQVFVLPLNYARETTASATTLAIFLPFLDEGSLAVRFFGMIDLFLIWWVIVVGIGLAVLYKRRTGPVVASLLGVYVLIAAIGATVMAVVAGGR